MAAPQEQAQEWLQSLGSEVADARGKVYLVTFARLLRAGNDGQLRSIDGVSKEDIAGYVRDAVENPEVLSAGKPRVREGPLVQKVVVVRELQLVRKLNPSFCKDA